VLALMAVLVDNQADKNPHHGPALPSPIEVNARAAQSDEGCDCARLVAVLGLERALIRQMWLIVALRWSLCVVATEPQTRMSQRTWPVGMAGLNAGQVWPAAAVRPLRTTTRLSQPPILARS